MHFLNEASCFFLNRNVVHAASEIPAEVADSLDGGIPVNSGTAGISYVQRDILAVGFFLAITAVCLI